MMYVDADIVRAALPIRRRLYRRRGSSATELDENLEGVLMRGLAIFALLLASASVTNAGESVTLRAESGKVAVSIDGKPFTDFVHEGYQKPFFIDVRAPQGTIVTRSLAEEAVTDHPHHKGIWLAIDEVNELKHWAERNAIRTKSVEVAKAEGNPAVLKVENEWLDADGKPLLLEKSTIRIFADRLISYDIEFAPAGDREVEFADTKEGLFAIRVRDELREKGGTGVLRNAEGKSGESETWGRASAWMDYSGEVEGKTMGVALFDHPENPRPGRYHARAYGLFTISPFGQSAYTNGELDPKPVHLKPNETLRLRYGTWIHEGDAEKAEVAKRHQQFVEDSKKTD